MTGRQAIEPERVEEQRQKSGGYTFNLVPPDEHDGTVITIAALRLGDHAHLEVSSGRYVSMPVSPHRVSDHRGLAGHLILRWDEWVMLRDHLAAYDNYRIAEVENPTRGQYDQHLPETVTR